MFSTTSAAFDLLAGDRLSGSTRKAWQLKDARERESTTAAVVCSSVLAMVVAAGGRQHPKKVGHSGRHVVRSSVLAVVVAASWWATYIAKKKTPLCPAPRSTATQLTFFHQQIHMFRCEWTHDTYA